MKAFELVGLMKDTNGKMIEAAGKIAGRYGQALLQEKIGVLAESRVSGMNIDEEQIEME